jgi:hypothetical protein
VNAAKQELVLTSMSMWLLVCSRTLWYSDLSRGDKLRVTDSYLAVKFG